MRKRLSVALWAAIVAIGAGVATSAEEPAWAPAHDLVSPEQMAARLGNMQGRTAQFCRDEKRPLMPCVVEQLAALQMAVDKQEQDKAGGDITYRLRLYNCLPEDTARPLDLEAVAVCYLGTEPTLPQ